MLVEVRMEQPDDVNKRFVFFLSLCERAELTAGCGARLDLATDDRNHDRAQMSSSIILWGGGGGMG